VRSAKGDIRHYVAMVLLWSDIMTLPRLASAIMANGGSPRGRKDLKMSQRDVVHGVRGNNRSFEGHPVLVDSR
jgi:hypothetical protein